MGVFMHMKLPNHCKKQQLHKQLVSSFDNEPPAKRFSIFAAVTEAVKILMKSIMNHILYLHVTSSNTSF